MSDPGEPKPVKLFVGLLASDGRLFPPVETDLSAFFGPIESASGDMPWSLTKYYEPEMGPALRRRFIAFASLISPAALSEIKHAAREIEERYRHEGGGRRVNIDPGYLDAGKVVLASTKGAGHRVYLRSGIYAEITLLYHDVSFHPLPYTYQDYLWPETTAFLAAARARYLEQLRRDTGGLL